MKRNREVKVAVISFFLGVILSTIVILVYLVSNNRTILNSNAETDSYGCDRAAGESWYNGTCRDKSEINAMMNAVSMGHTLDEVRDPSFDLNDFSGGFKLLLKDLDEIAKCSPTCPSATMKRFRELYLALRHWEN